MTKLIQLFKVSGLFIFLWASQIANASLIQEVYLTTLDGNSLSEPLLFGTITFPSFFQLPVEFGNLPNANCSFLVGDCLEATFTPSNWDGFQNISGSDEDLTQAQTGTGFWSISDQDWSLVNILIRFDYDFGEIIGLNEDAFQFVVIHFNSFGGIGVCAATFLTLNSVPGCGGQNTGLDRLEESVIYIPIHESVPEPSIIALFALGLAGIAFYRRKKSIWHN